MKNLTEKVAVVTGSSKGIGAAIALRLAQEGAKVIVNYSGNQAAADETVSRITSIGGQAIAIKADVSSKEEVIRLFDESIEHFGKVDIWVNNAGVMFNAPIKDLSEEQLEKQLDINFKGVFYSLQQAATKLSDNGSIINLSSTVTRTIFPTYAVYAATKAAVEQMSRIFAKEIGSRGINVNCVLPGPTGTDLFLNGKSEEQIKRLASTNGFGRLGTPEDIAEVVAFLASDQAKWISGQSIGANGGMA
ncbi:SDR family oxidoreductase [Chryseobacterium geocarposphaerae]|uniref:3-oxoacyl-[acyl-carrier protein] reductase n=1 Tax=Chryseobacterium geocarposphaerae TaxID=1416776 RepID=A0A2M9BXJ0_9FLAO|nr:SDR family oxidoreductase [Chryseobacterium geocarposphaerae]PJJ62803.1 3-oxoacyl-[acyl-carrier protein] reductase [Chryseobacterium geocarposphaerae]